MNSYPYYYNAVTAKWEKQEGQFNASYVTSAPPVLLTGAQIAALALTLVAANDGYPVKATTTSDGYIDGYSYTWNGGTLVFDADPRVTSGATDVHIRTTDILSPEYNYYTDTLSILAAGTNTPVTSGDISGYSHGIIVVTATAETIALTAYLDDAHTIETSAITVYTTAQVATVATALASGTYYIKDAAFKALHATKSANVNAATIQVVMKS